MKTTKKTAVFCCIKHCITHPPVIQCIDTVYRKCITRYSRAVNTCKTTQKTDTVLIHLLKDIITVSLSPSLRGSDVIHRYSARYF